MNKHIRVCGNCLHSWANGEDLRLVDIDAVIHRGIREGKLSPAATAMAWEDVLHQYTNTNGLSEDEALEELTGEPTPWANYKDTQFTVTSDYCADHYFRNDSGTCANDCNYGPDDDGGYDTFSTTPCEGCGSRLAGDRYRFAAWED